MPSTRAGLSLRLSLLILAGLLAAALLSQSCEAPSSIAPLPRPKPPIDHRVAATPSPGFDGAPSALPHGQRGGESPRPPGKSLPQVRAPDLPVTSVRRNAEVLRAE